ncbi:MAG: class I SAM-dependent methyltransferase [Bdellovibrionales bacterium]|nr:class I SAM-dependent methyltransferase [Bdellovibrionales bacterium]
MSSDYEKVRFFSLPSPEKHPSRIGAIAKIMGLEAKPIEESRILEIACGAGENLLPIACVYPNAEFLGLDSADKLLKEAKLVAEELKLKNVSFKNYEIGKTKEDFGKFDYIICYGMFSWVAEEIQKSLIQFVKNSLADNGLACISYNSLPGWNLRSSLRDVCKIYDKNSRLPEERIENVKKLLNSLKDLQVDDYSPYGQQLREQLEFLDTQSSGFIFHELLGDQVSATSIDQFSRLIEAESMYFNGDARLSRMRFLSLSDQQSQESIKHIDVKNLTLSELESLADVVNPLSFRTTVFSKNKTKTIDINAISKLYLSSPLVPLSKNPDITGTGAEEFIDAREYTEKETNPLMKACLIFLKDIWPESVALKDLINLAANRFNLDTDTASTEYVRERFLALGCMGMADFFLSEPKCLKHAGEFPIAHPYARFQSKETKKVTNYRHEYSLLDDFQRIMINFMDGTRDIPALQSAMVKAFIDGKLNISEDGKPLKNPLQAEELVREQTINALRMLSESALLSAD